jgi:hypothetical protein
MKTREQRQEQLRRIDAWLLRRKPWQLLALTLVLGLLAGGCLIAILELLDGGPPR